MPGEEKPVILVADDEPNARGLINMLCGEIGFDVPEELRHIENAAQAIKAANKYYQAGRLAGVVTDLSMTGLSGHDEGGWDVVRHCRELSPNLPIAILTGFVETAPSLRIFKVGAALARFSIYDKSDPPDGASGADTIRRWLQEAFDGWTSKLSTVLRDARTERIYSELAPIYAKSSLPILLIGETGTGKESLARHIHAQSDSHRGPFISVNCGALEESTAFAELFGHQQGSFTGAVANDLGLVLRASGYDEPAAPKKEYERFSQWLDRGNKIDPPASTDPFALYRSEAVRKRSGTLFLDEIAALPRKTMAGLLRLLSNQEVVPLGHRGKGFQAYCRVIAATNEIGALLNNSSETGRERAFRDDLYYRLNGAILHLPPLRERTNEDIEFFLLQSSTWNDLGMTRMDFVEAAVDRLTNLFRVRTDPVALQFQAGNFRSLRHLIQRAALLAKRDGANSIEASHIDLAIEHGMIKVPDKALQTAAVGEGEFDWIKFVRSQFLRFAKEVSLGVDDSLHDLKDVTAQNPVPAAKAFIQCLLMPKGGADASSGHYTQNDIEYAITGKKSPNNYVSKDLKAKDFADAAKRYFGVDVTDPQAKISDVVKSVRARQAKGSVGDKGARSGG